MRNMLIFVFVLRIWWCEYEYNPGWVRISNCKKVKSGFVLDGPHSMDRFWVTVYVDGHARNLTTSVRSTDIIRQKWVEVK